MRDSKTSLSSASTASGLPRSMYPSSSRTSMSTPGCEWRWHSPGTPRGPKSPSRRYLGPVCFPVLKAAPNTTICTAIRAVVKRNQPLLHARGMASPGGRSRPAASPATPARPHRDQDLKGRPRQLPGLPQSLPGHQDHPPAAGHGHRQDHPRDRLRHHQPDQRARHRGRPGPRALVHRGTSPYKSGTRRSARTPPPAGPATGPATWPPSAQPSSRPSRMPATCTSPRAGATHHPAETLRLHSLD
jgi:hypothetical protein